MTRAYIHVVPWVWFAVVGISTPDFSDAQALSFTCSPVPDTASAESREWTPRLCTTILGTKFEVRPAFDSSIADTIAKIRKDLQEAHQNHFTGYISTPVSGKGGGDLGTNVDIAAYVRKHIIKRYGPDRFWALSPAHYDLPEIERLPDNKKELALPSEYQFMWTEILAGKDGKGRDFDLFYFVGPSDVAAFLKIEGEDVLGKLDKFIEQRAAKNKKFKREIAEDKERRKGYLYYYGLKASTSFSLGSSDEWNIARLINSNREIPDQIPLYFDGHAVSPAEMQTKARTGNEKQ